jgi:hypothetical protein
VALYSDKYPDGDRGGNSIKIRISSSPTNLHSFWDGLLGRGTTAGNIGKDVQETQKVLSDKAEAIKPDMAAHKTPEGWAKESAALARKVVYLDGTYSSHAEKNRALSFRRRLTMRRRAEEWRGCRSGRQGRDWPISS